jgi:hypothetical protein
VVPKSWSASATLNRLENRFWEGSFGPEAVICELAENQTFEDESLHYSGV